LKSSSALSKRKPEEDDDEDINKQIAGIEEDLKGYDIANEKAEDQPQKKQRPQRQMSNKTSELAN